jgi:hypothetical protein
MVAFEERDLVTFEAQPLGDCAPDDPTTDDDDPRHIDKDVRA